MTRPRVPGDPDDDTTRQVARTFLVVRIVRGTLLLLFLVIALLAVQLKNWPAGVSLAVALTIVLQLGRLAAQLSALRAAHRAPAPGHGR